MKLTVERASTEFFLSSCYTVTVDAHVMEAAGLAPGDVAFLHSETGRRLLVRLGEPLPDDAGTGLVRLDRFMRQGLKVRLGQPVTLKPAEEQDLAPVRRVLLEPAIDVSLAHHLVEHLHHTLVHNRTPVSLNAVLYATFHRSKGGTTYRVVHLDGGPGVVTEETVIEVQAIAGHAPESEVTYEDIGGLGREISLLRELVQVPLSMPHVYRQLGIRPPRGVILYGPPGVGKTLLMKALANEVNARFYYVNGPDIIGTYHGEAEANLRKLFGEAAHHAPSIMFFDEIDALAPKRGETGAHADTRMVSQFLTLLDGLVQVDGVVAIATTNRVNAIDPALRRPGRFDREIYVGPPDATGRLDVLSIHAREMPLTEAAREVLPDVARRCHGFVGADLLELCREAGLNALRRQLPGVQPGAAGSPDLSDITVDSGDFESAMTRIQPSALRESLVTVPRVSWDDVGGLHQVKERLDELVRRFLRPDGRRGRRSSHGILLHGPAGTGKTMLAQAVAHAAGVSFIAVDGPEFFSQWLGESEEAIRHTFQLARQLAPAIIFIDQLDAVAPVRGDGDSTKTAERVVNQLLAEMDGIQGSAQVMVMAATNRPDLIDPALLRPGRFGVRLLVPLPDAAERLEILRSLLRHLPMAPGNWLAKVAVECGEKSGADLALLCDEAEEQMLVRGDREINADHFAAAHIALGQAAFAGTRG